MRADPFVTIVPGEGFLGMVTVKTELGKIFLDVGMVQTRRYLRVDPRLAEQVASSGTRVMRCGCSCVDICVAIATAARARCFFVATSLCVGKFLLMTF